MTQVMSQPGFGLTAPSSRQDVISALLNEYGNSFGRGDVSPYSYSPGFKELPPCPPEKDDSPLSLMNARFQLRVDEPQSPILHNGDRKNSLGSSPPSPPTKIVYRSLSRTSKPRSLKLTISNGSTAVVPPTPSIPAPSSILPSSTVSKPLPNPVPEPAAVEERPLPPPPPPEKSERRQQPAMGSNVTKSLRDRKDSAESQDVAAKQESNEAASRSSPVVKRKAVPETKKFKSLADLGVGPRGGKNGPLPRMPPASNNSSNDSVVTVTPASVAQEKASNSTARSQSVEGLSRKPLPVPRSTMSNIEVSARLPPTPDEQASDIGPPAPPKKAWTMGLPSNPRARSQGTPTSAKHQRGKSSTGFDLMKSKSNTEDTSARPTNLTTITPGPTPSPIKTTAVQALGSTFPNSKGPQSPVSPITDDDAHRPFSYEAVVKQPPRPQDQSPPRTQSAKSYRSTSPVSPPAVATSFPPRSTSRPQQAKTFAQIQQQTSRSPSPPTLDSPPFTPNVVKPSPSAAAPITDKHLNCYAHHANYVWSKNECQPMACMVCHENSREKKWACTWCYLRVCLTCSDDLMRTPGRNLKAVMGRRGRNSAGAASSTGAMRYESDGREGSTSRDGSIPQMVIWEVENEEEKDDFS